MTRPAPVIAGIDLFAAIYIIPWWIVAIAVLILVAVLAIVFTVALFFVGKKK